MNNLVYPNKDCSKCGLSKSYIEFYPCVYNRKSKGRCKACMNSYMNKYRETNHEEIKAKAKDNYFEWTLNQIEYDQYKKEKLLNAK